MLRQSAELVPRSAEPNSSGRQDTGTTRSGSDKPDSNNDGYRDR
jgi:hypothetical protein